MALVAVAVVQQVEEEEEEEEDQAGVVEVVEAAAAAAAEEEEEEEEGQEAEAVVVAAVVVVVVVVVVGAVAMRAAVAAGRGEERTRVSRPSEPCASSAPYPPRWPTSSRTTGTRSCARAPRRPAWASRRERRPIFWSTVCLAVSLVFHD